MTEDNWLLKAIEAKSDQLNAVDLMAGPITVTIKSVAPTGSKEQPCAIVYDDPQRPFKPCKTMLRLLVAVWGLDANVWLNRQLTLFRDPSVKLKGEAVGGARVSHMSHLQSESMTVEISGGRHKKVFWTVFNIPTEEPKQPPLSQRVDKAVKAILSCNTADKLERCWSNCAMLYESCDEVNRSALDAAKTEQEDALKNA